MLRLLWVIYLCFDQITKNMNTLHNTYFTHICGGGNVRLETKKKIDLAVKQEEVENVK